MQHIYKNGYLKYFCLVSLETNGDFSQCISGV